MKTDKSKLSAAELEYFESYKYIAWLDTIVSVVNFGL
jgi:hypothetical protein